MSGPTDSIFGALQTGLGVASTSLRNFNNGIAKALTGGTHTYDEFTGWVEAKANGGSVADNQARNAAITAEGNKAMPATVVRAEEAVGGVAGVATAVVAVVATGGAVAGGLSAGTAAGAGGTTLALETGGTTLALEAGGTTAALTTEAAGTTLVTTEAAVPVMATTAVPAVVATELVAAPVLELGAIPTAAVGGLTTAETIGAAVLGATVLKPTTLADMKLSHSSPSAVHHHFGGVHFGYNSATLDAASKKTLDTIVAKLKTNGVDKVRLDGFADATGSDRGNDALSHKRSEAVQAYLKEKGITANCEEHAHGSQGFTKGLTNEAARSVQISGVVTPEIKQASGAPVFDEPKVAAAAPRQGGAVAQQVRPAHHGVVPA